MALAKVPECLGESANWYNISEASASAGETTGATFVNDFPKQEMDSRLLLSTRSCQFHWRVPLSQSHSKFTCVTGRSGTGRVSTCGVRRRADGARSQARDGFRPLPLSRSCKCRMCHPSNSQSRSISSICNRKERHPLKRPQVRHLLRLRCALRHGCRNGTSLSAHLHIISNSRISLIHHHFFLAGRSGDIIFFSRGLWPKE